MNTPSPRPNTNDSACINLEQRLCTELGPRPDWWLLSSGRVTPCPRRGAVAHWRFPDGTYAVWFIPTENLWCIQLPDGLVIVTQRGTLQARLWRAILQQHAAVS